jgi:putative tricarboxylic transport membrane protein
MGVFGFAEIIANLEHGGEKRRCSPTRSARLMPTWDDLKAGRRDAARHRLGSVLGVLPGGGALLSSFASYASRRSSAARTGPAVRPGQHPRRRRAGVGQQRRRADLVHPDADARHPANAVMALMIGAMTIHNIQPGPQVMTSNPTLFWGLIASMWIGNLMLVILNLPLIGMWVQLLKVPYRLLYPAILVFCAIGVYSINNNPFDVLMTAIFGAVGYLFSSCAASRRR